MLVYIPGTLLYIFWYIPYWYSIGYILKHFIALPFPLTSTVHLELIFVSVWGYSPAFTFPHVDKQLAHPDPFPSILPSSQHNVPTSYIHMNGKRAEDGGKADLIRGSNLTFTHFLCQNVRFPWESDRFRSKWSPHTLSWGSCHSTEVRVAVPESSMPSLWIHLEKAEVGILCKSPD